MKHIYIVLALYYGILIALPLEAMRQCMRSAHLYMHHKQQIVKKGVATITLGGSLYGYVWLRNEEKVHLAVSKALANDELDKAQLLLQARRILLRDNRPLSHLQYACPAQIPRCRHNLLADVNKVIRRRDAPECLSLLKSRASSDDLKQIAAIAAAAQRNNTKKTIMEMCVHE